MSGQRNVSSYPHPMYDAPGFGLDALSKASTNSREVVGAQSGTFTSNAIAHGTNGFELWGVFASAATEAELQILNAADSDKVLFTYTLTPGVVKFFTFYDTRLQITAYPSIKFKIVSVTGTGTVAIKIRPTS